jgi:hypothetical protein
MSLVTTDSPARTPAIQDHDADHHTDRPRWSDRSWVWTLIESLAYAGAPIDPTAALAARRFARVRDQELQHGRS